jgi:hypothetical protein
MVMERVVDVLVGKLCQVLDAEGRGCCDAAAGEEKDYGMIADNRVFILGEASLSSQQIPHFEQEMWILLRIQPSPKV